MCMWVPMNMCACVWRLDVDVRCLSQLISTLYFETLSFTESGAHCCGQACCSVSLSESPVSASACITTQALSMGTGNMNSTISPSQRTYSFKFAFSLVHDVENIFIYTFASCISLYMNLLTLWPILIELILLLKCKSFSDKY